MDERPNVWTSVTLMALVGGVITALLYTDRGRQSLHRVETALDKRASMQGFIITDHLELWPNAIRELAEHVRSGRLHWRESIAEGLEAAPEAFFAMLKGGNFGKQLVKLI